MVYPVKGQIGVLELMANSCDMPTPLSLPLAAKLLIFVLVVFCAQEQNAYRRKYQNSKRYWVFRKIQVI